MSREPPSISPTAARRYDPRRFDLDANADLDDLRSDRSYDALDELLENYSVNLIPTDVKFKFRKNVRKDSMTVGGTVTTGFRLSPVPLRAPRVALMVKPIDRSKWWNSWWSKAEIGPRFVNVRTNKFTVFKYFNLQFELGHGYGIRTPLRWRVDTIWNPQKQLLHKQCLNLHRGGSSSLDLRPHFGVDMKMPHAESGFTNSSSAYMHGDSDDGTETELGHCHVTMPLLEFVYKKF